MRSKVTDLVSRVTKDNLEDLQQRGADIRSLISKAPLPTDLSQEILAAYKELSAQYETDTCSVAVRSSATAEDLPHASFAGQQETYLNVLSPEDLLEACANAFASLFTDRAISYRIDYGFEHMDVALSIGVQKMVRSDRATAGVLFTLDTESGFRDVIFINSSYGLGESVVKGTVSPDEFFVHKPTLREGHRALLKRRLGDKRIKVVYADGVGGTVEVDVDAEAYKAFSLTDDEVLELAGYVLTIEDHYTSLRGSWAPMDIEWAKDGDDGKLYIVQARPETVHSLRAKEGYTYTEYKVDAAAVAAAKELVVGKSVGSAMVTGTARVIADSSQMNELKEGEILITDMTDPDWEPILKRAGGVITNRGGRTCHAAIVSRELGIPAIVGAAGATESITTGSSITLDCSRGERGVVYEGAISFDVKEHTIEALPEVPAQIMVNLGDPDSAFRHAHLPVAGVGLARLEFIISSSIGVHPMALVHPEKIADEDIKQKIAERAYGYENGSAFFVDTLAREIGTIVAAFYPRPVIVRLSDFKSNEYRGLLGGEFFEPEEENPMVGFRGASRYDHDHYREAFALECAALKRVRDEMGLTNARVMVPFVRTVSEAERVVAVLESHGLGRGANGLELYMMVEVPSNVILLDQFAKHFDGFSIGSNDLTQFTLAVDRDSELIATLFDERDPAVKAMMGWAIDGAKKVGKPIGICGQAPSDFPELASFLIERGITSLSLNSDSVITTILTLGERSS